MADQMENTDAKRHIECDDEPQAKHQKLDPETTTKITDLNDKCLMNIFSYLDLSSLLNVAMANKRLQVVAASTFGNKFGMKTICLQNYINFNTPRIYTLDDDIYVRGLRLCLQFLRGFGSTITDLVVFDGTNPHVLVSKEYKNKFSHHVDRYLNQYCAENLSSLLFYGRSAFSLENFRKPFRMVNKTCETFIIVCTAAVIKSRGFLACDKRVLAHILMMNVLSCSEVDVFEACMEWVKAKTGEDSLTKEIVDMHLGRLYFEIRFKSMSIQQFCLLTAKYDSVLRSDYFTLTNMIVSPEFQPENFIKCPRQAEWNEHEIIVCDRALSDDQKPYKLVHEYKMIFGTDKPLLLGSIVCMKIRLYHSYYRDRLVFLATFAYIKHFGSIFYRLTIYHVGIESCELSKKSRTYS